MRCRPRHLRAVLLLLAVTVSCSGGRCAPRTDVARAPEPSVAAPPPAPRFRSVAESFADVQVLRYSVEGFQALPARTKRLLYSLQRAALSGRDVVYDQRYRHNLAIRHTLEAILRGYQGPRETRAFDRLRQYTKRVWLAHGVHDPRTQAKFLPQDLTPAHFDRFVRRTDAAQLPAGAQQDPGAWAARLTPPIFDPHVAAYSAARGPGQDPVADSANHFYVGVTGPEVHAYYAERTDATDAVVAAGSNSQLVRSSEGGLVARPWTAKGMYGPALSEVVRWLEQAAQLADGPSLRSQLQQLAHFYRDGNLAAYARYRRAWEQGSDSPVELIHGFVDPRWDALGRRGGLVALLMLQAPSQQKAVDTLAGALQRFAAADPRGERPAPPDPGVRAVDLVTSVGLSPQGGPLAFPGDRSGGGERLVVTNLQEARIQAEQLSGVGDALTFTAPERTRARAHGVLAAHRLGQLHAVVGHPLARTAEAAPTGAARTLLGELQAELLALHWMLDPLLIELGLIPSLDVGRAAYDQLVREALLLEPARLPAGAQPHDTRTRVRRWIARWALRAGEPDTVIEEVRDEGVDYFVVRDYPGLRALFAQLLEELDEALATGDGAALLTRLRAIEAPPDAALHRQLVARLGAQGAARHWGLIAPRLTAIEREGEQIGVRIEYPQDLTARELELSARYGLLPLPSLEMP